MATTAEEALEQGWLQPIPTFFGTDGQMQDFAGKCHASPWVLMRRTSPSEESGMRPRPMTYMRFPEYR